MEKELKPDIELTEEEEHIWLVLVERVEVEQDDVGETEGGTVMKPPLCITRLGFRARSWLSGTSWMSWPDGFRKSWAPVLDGTGCRTILWSGVRGVRGCEGAHDIGTAVLVPGTGIIKTWDLLFKLPVGVLWSEKVIF